MTEADPFLDNPAHRQAIDFIVEGLVNTEEVKDSWTLTKELRKSPILDSIPAGRRSVVAIQANVRGREIARAITEIRYEL